jgi:hypothetical protein
MTAEEGEGKERRKRKHCYIASFVTFLFWWGEKKNAGLRLIV